MSIELEDLNLLKELREQFPDGSSCAILGDCRIHNLSGIEEFKNVMNFKEVDTFDVNGNPSFKEDLNNLLDESFHNRYDWVIDSGTMYCCFDTCTVWQNIINMLKDKGCILHTGNLSGFYGRGFYSLSPSLFRDFYNANGFDIKMMGSKTRQQREWVKFDPKNTYLEEASDNAMSFAETSRGYIPLIPNDAMISCFATRSTKVEFKKPIPQHFIDTNGG